MCACNQEDILKILGYSLWIPRTYNLNDVVINPGNSNLYVSIANDNTTIPAQPGALWAITTVAELINSGGAGSGGFTWPAWVSDGGAGPSGDYLLSQAVTYNGGNYISLTDGNVDVPEGSANWQSFAMNAPG